MSLWVSLKIYRVHGIVMEMKAAEVTEGSWPFLSMIITPEHGTTNSERWAC